MSKALESAKDTAKSAADSANSAAGNPKAATQDFLHHPWTRAALPFVNGGISGMFATTCIQPIDMVKVRIQVAGEGAKGGPRRSPISGAREILAQGKVLDLYTGLSAGLLRQAV